MRIEYINPANTKSRNILGSSQYKKIRKISQSCYWSLLLLPSIASPYYISSNWNEVFPQVKAAVISPMPNEQIDKIIATPTPKYHLIETTENEDIRNYIKEVFGEDQDKAFTLLSCENADLDPNIVNTAGNEPAGSRDVGVFQINEYWQEVQYKYLLNWKINIQIAYQIFIEDGKSFKQWTCGRSLGI
jgi:hypothetical protein